mmetsp:Transcript_2269/g.6883  ORF Transcript_2269/g.6883 Transcript_2269/m.6883 type:complete len:225 (-) Transcript_2269:325-999(-)
MAPLLGAGEPVALPPPPCARRAARCSLTTLQSDTDWSSKGMIPTPANESCSHVSRMFSDMVPMASSVPWKNMCWMVTHESRPLHRILLRASMASFTSDTSAAVESRKRCSAWRSSAESCSRFPPSRSISEVTLRLYASNSARAFLDSAILASRGLRASISWRMGRKSLRCIICPRSVRCSLLITVCSAWKFEETRSRGGLDAHASSKASASLVLASHMALRRWM